MRENQGEEDEFIIVKNFYFLEEKNENLASKQNPYKSAKKHKAKEENIHHSLFYIQKDALKSGIDFQFNFKEPLAQLITVGIRKRIYVLLAIEIIMD